MKTKAKKIFKPVKEMDASGKTFDVFKYVDGGQS